MLVAGLALALTLPTIAFAANTATFSGAAPKPASSSTVSKPTVSITVYDKYGSYGSDTKRMWVNGTRVYPTVSYVKGYGHRKFKLTYNIKTSLSLGSHAVTVKIHDLHGKDSSYSWTFTEVDRTAPTTTLSSSSSANAAGWDRTSVVVTLHATDNAGGSGVAHMYYAIGGGATTTYTVPFAVSAEGTSSVQYWSVDNADNRETAKSASAHIDSRPPTIGAMTPLQTSSSNPTLSVSVTDLCSGVAHATFTVLTEGGLGLGTYDCSTGCLSYKPLLPLVEGQNGVLVDAYDAAGNHVSKLQYVIVENTVTFDSQGGTPVSPAQGVNYSLAANMPADPTQHGYVFAGWNTKADGSGTVFDAATPITGDITVYAQWTVAPKPVISAVSISSNSAKGASVAADGDIITLTFTSNEPVSKLGNFKINGSNPDSFTNVGSVYTATHLVDSGDAVTGDPATFQINVKNGDGIYSQTTEVTNDGSSVTIVDPKPVISAVHFASNSVKGSGVAEDGDTLTLTFTSDEPVTKLGNFKINGSNPDTFVGDGHDHYTATHLVDSGDPVTGLPATFQINVKNAAGVYSQTIEVTNDGSSVLLALPVRDVSISSNSAKGSHVAANGDIITLTFTTDEPVSKLGNFKINGSNPDSFTNVGNVYTATHLVDSGDAVTGDPASFQINVKNAAGVYSQTIEVTNDGSSVTIVDPKPVISAVHISSNSAAGPSVAANGDVITLTFTTDEPVSKLGNFKINSSNPDSFTNVGNVYTATHLVDSGDPITGLPATFQINVKNAAGIYSQTVEVTNDGSSVTIGN